MFRITHKEKAAADRLRREIDGTRPAFSEELHTRLCRALQQHRAEIAPSPRRQPAANRLARWASVAAATCLLAAVCAAWQAMHVVRDAGHDAPVLANRRKAGLGGVAELAGRVATKTDAMVDVAIKAQRWAYLDQDARSILKTPAARLPFDVVSSLLSMQRKNRTRGPSSPAAPRSGNVPIQEQAGVRDG